MANMHVRGRTPRGYSVVCHFAIPNSNNDVGLNYRTAYARSKGTLTSVLPDGDGTLGTISAAEKTSVTQAAPALAESVQEFQIPDDWGALNGTQRQALLDAWYTQASAEWTAGNGVLLQFWGFTR
jgi:hypothetical protein